MRSKLITSIALLLAHLAACAQDAPRSQLVVIGDVTTLLVGQDGYCGSMERVNGDDLRKMTVTSGARTWIRYVHGGVLTGKCSLDFSFQPQPAQAYIARYAIMGRTCQVELFRIRPGQDPAREPLTPEADRSCLLQ